MDDSVINDKLIENNNEIIIYTTDDGQANKSIIKLTGEEDYPNTKILDTYSLEFLDLPNNYSEKD